MTAALIAELRQTVAFFVSVIHSGESWSEECQRRYELAVQAISALSAQQAGEPTPCFECDGTEFADRVCVFCNDIVDRALRSAPAIPGPSSSPGILANCACPDAGGGGRFRKKPVVIDAWPFDGSYESVRVLLPMSSDITFHGDGYLTIKTLEGTHRADPGDWIIRGVKGEFYPCKPDIFAATYEPAKSAPSPVPETPPATTWLGGYDDGGERWRAKLSQIRSRR